MIEKLKNKQFLCRHCGEKKKKKSLRSGCINLQLSFCLKSVANSLVAATDLLSVLHLGNDLLRSSIWLQSPPNIIGISSESKRSCDRQDFFLQPIKIGCVDITKSNWCIQQLTVHYRISESINTSVSLKVTDLLIKMETPLLLPIPGLEKTFPTHKHLSFKDSFMFICISCTKAIATLDDFTYVSVFSFSSLHYLGP